MKTYIGMGLFLNSLQEKLAKLCVMLTYRATQKKLSSLLYLTLACFVAFALGAYCIPLGAFNSATKTFSLLRRYIDELTENNQTV